MQVKPPSIEGGSEKYILQVFLCLSALVAASSAAPQILRGGLGGVGVTSTRLGGAPTVGAPTPPHPITNGVRGVGVGHGLVGGVAQAVATHAAPLVSTHAVAAPLVASVAHPVAHGVGFGHGPVGHTVAHPIAHAVAEVYPDEVSPYTYQYAVADDYSGARFDAQESDDGTAARQGHYSVSLPDGRIQHVNYHANDIDGYVAEVTYDGQAVFPDVVAAPVAHAIARPVLTHAVARPAVVGVGHGIAHGGLVGHGVGIAHGGVAHIG